MSIALCYVLPFLTGNIPQIGNMLCPMHIPVLLCGYICGPFYGLMTGVISPLLRSLTIGAPALFPNAFAMAFELAAYGFFSGLLYKKLPKTLSSMYISLLSAMVIGRLIWGAVRVVVFGFGGSAFGWSAFMAGAFTGAIPGIVLQIILIPAIVMTLKKSRLIKNE